jgi:hypothetical protein
MAMSDGQDARLERRLRLALRLVLYPLAIGLIVLTWQRTHPKTAELSPITQAQPTRVRPPAVRWIGATEQGQPVQAATVDGVLTYLQTRVVTHCSDGSTWTLWLSLTSADLQQSGETVSSGQRPLLTTSNQGEPVVISFRLRSRMDGQRVGAILSEVTRNPGHHSTQCSAYGVKYRLSRAADRRSGDMGAPCPALPKCFRRAGCWADEFLAEATESPLWPGELQTMGISGVERSALACRKASTSPPA